MGSIFNMFGPSPIKPLEQHMRKVQSCTDKLYPFFEAVNKDHWTLAQELQKTISELENDADDLKRELRLNLPSGLFLPVYRSDILSLLSKQDAIANKAKDIAGLVLGRKMQLPENLIPQYMPFLKRCIEASQQACTAINELDQLLETGFRGNEVKVVQEMIVKLDSIEHDTDEMLINIRKEIFTLEESMPAIKVIFLYKLVEWTGFIADSAQTVGGRLQLLLAR